ncbi:MAG: gliding motility-associated C-terminal domain-containing protein [Bacteroidales bacterium]
MENEHSKIGELYKKAFEDYKPEPSSGVWDKIAQRPELIGSAPPSAGNSWWKWLLGGASVTAVIIAVLFVITPGEKPSNPLQLNPGTTKNSSQEPVNTNQEPPTLTSSPAESVSPRNDVKSSTEIQPLTKRNNPVIIHKSEPPVNILPELKENTLGDILNQDDKPAKPAIQTAVNKPLVSNELRNDVKPSLSGGNESNPAPNEGIEVISSQKHCYGEDLTLWAKGGITYTWSTGENTETILVNPTGTSVYSVTVTDHTGQPTTFDITINVINCKSIYVPTAFSPNGDGDNEIFQVKGTDISNFTLRIVSRTGQIIFETHDINEGWDGRIKGKAAEMGVYVYQVIYTDSSGKERKETGQLTLLK